MRKFSRRGERVTDFERTLIAECDDSRSAFLDLARRIGIDALVVVLDEFASEKIHVPTRESFFAGLYRRLRDEEILRRLANGEHADDIADDIGCSRSTVFGVQRAGRHCTAAEGIRAP